jgi:hypothetical protein
MTHTIMHREFCWFSRNDFLNSRGTSTRHELLPHSACIESGILIGNSNPPSERRPCSHGTHKNRCWNAIAFELILIHPTQIFGAFNETKNHDTIEQNNTNKNTKSNHSCFR